MDEYRKVTTKWTDDEGKKKTLHHYSLGVFNHVPYDRQLEITDWLTGLTFKIILWRQFICKEETIDRPMVRDIHTYTYQNNCVNSNLALLKKGLETMDGGISHLTTLMNLHNTYSSQERKL